MASAFTEQAARQTPLDRNDTFQILGILEEKRAEILANDRAGYFIRDWQELTGQVRQLIAKDSRYQAIKANRAARALTLSMAGKQGDTNL